MSKIATTKASWARRWPVRGRCCDAAGRSSRARSSCVRLANAAREGPAWGSTRCPFGGAVLRTTRLGCRVGDLRAHEVVVVAAVEMQRPDPASSPGRRPRRGSPARSMSRCGSPARDPADRDAGLIGRDRPLPAELSPVNRAFAGPFTAAGRLVQRAVDRDLARRGRPRGHRWTSIVSASSSKTPGRGPLVAPGPQRRVRDLPPTRRSASTQEHPVTRRTSIAHRHIRSEIRGR